MGEPVLDSHRGESSLLSVPGLGVGVVSILSPILSRGRCAMFGKERERERRSGREDSVFSTSQSGVNGRNCPRTFEPEIHFLT